MKKRRAREFTVLATAILALISSGCRTGDFYHTWIRDTPVDWALGLTRYALGGDIDFDQMRSSGYYFKVTTSPPGAQITLDGVYVGTSPCSVRETARPIGHLYVIRASLPGYRDGVATYVNRPPFPAIKDTTISLEPLEETRPVKNLPPGKGMLCVAATPIQADISINGKYRGQSPCRILLSPGRYTVRVACPDYVTYEKIVEIVAGAWISLRPSLKPAP